MIQDCNQVTLRGTIVQMNISNKLSQIRIITNTDRGDTNFPNVYVYDKKLLGDFKVNDRVFIVGHTQNTNVYYNGTMKTGSATVLVADQIFPAMRHLCDYFSPEEIGDAFKGGHADDINRIIVCGTVMSKYFPDKTNKNSEYVSLKISINAPETEQVRQCDVICAKKYARIAKKINKGDRVVFVGFCYTNIKKKEDKSKIYYEQIYCRDLAILD